MYIYIYVYVYIYVYIYIYVTYVYIHIHMCICICECMYMYIYTPTETFTYFFVGVKQNNISMFHLDLKKYIYLKNRCFVSYPLYPDYLEGFSWEFNTLHAFHLATPGPKWCPCEEPNHDQL